MSLRLAVSAALFLTLAVACGEADDDSDDSPIEDTDGEPKPRPPVSSSSSSGETGSSSGETGSSSGSWSTSSSSSGGPDEPECDDPDDALGEAQPTVLPATNDTDVDPRHSVSGILSSLDDVDAYSVYVKDETSIVDFLVPRAYTRVNEAKLCMYIQCARGTLTNIQCAEGVTASTSELGWRGCCGRQVADIRTYECSGADDSLNVLMMISSEGAVCQPYSIEYVF